MKEEMQWDSATSEEDQDFSDYFGIGLEEDGESEWGNEIWEDWDSASDED